MMRRSGEDAVAPCRHAWSLIAGLERLLLDPAGLVGSGTAKRSLIVVVVGQKNEEALTCIGTLR